MPSGRPNRYVDFETNFWSKVDRSKGDDHCWLWLAGTSHNGYGRIWYEGNTVRATHVAWFLVHGEWPNDLQLQALHHCDNPPCVNVVNTLEHVFLGTHHVNMLDCSAKGRQKEQSGLSHPLCGIQPETVSKIREMSKTMKPSQVADTLGMGRMTVWRIINHKARLNG